MFSTFGPLNFRGLFPGLLKSNFDVLWLFINIDGLKTSFVFTSFCKSPIFFFNFFISIFNPPTSFLLFDKSLFDILSFSSNSLIFWSFLFFSDFRLILSLSSLSVYSNNWSLFSWHNIFFFLINLSVNDIFILSISVKALKSNFSFGFLFPSVFSFSSCFSNISFIRFLSIISSFSFFCILFKTLSIKLSYSSLLFAAANLSSVICALKSISFFWLSSNWIYKSFICFSFWPRSFINSDISSFLFSNSSFTICISS